MFGLRSVGTIQAFARTESQVRRIFHSHNSNEELAPAHEDLVRLTEGRCTGNLELLVHDRHRSQDRNSRVYSPTDVRMRATTCTAAYAFSRL